MVREDSLTFAVCVRLAKMGVEEAGFGHFSGRSSMLVAAEVVNEVSVGGMTIFWVPLG